MIGKYDHLRQMNAECVVNLITVNEGSKYHPQINLKALASVLSANR